MGLSCGSRAPGEFYSDDVLTGLDGYYLLEAEAPGVYGPPAKNGIEFLCRLQARQASGPVVVDSTIALRFAPTRETAPVVTVNLLQH